MNELEVFRNKVNEYADTLNTYDEIEKEWMAQEGRKQRMLNYRNALKPAYISKAVIIFFLWMTVCIFVREATGISDNVLFEKSGGFVFFVICAVEILYGKTFPMFSLRYKKAEQKLQTLEKDMEENLNGRIDFIFQCMADNFPEIPETYRSSSIIRTFAGYIDTRRVHDFESMFNLYETELHQARLEAGQQQIQSELAAQSSMINWLSSQIH